MPADVTKPKQLAKVKSQRLRFVDNFKGLLVVLMVFYHSAFVLHAEQRDAYLFITRNMVFLHSAFLFVTGFLVGSYYFSRQQPAGFSASWRLLTRAMKIAAVFVTANLLVTWCGLGSAASSNLLSWKFLRDSLLVSVSGEAFAFEILAYFVMYLTLAALTVRVSDRIVWSMSLLILLAYACWPSSKTLLMLLMALAGECAGRAYSTGGLQRIASIGSQCSTWIRLLVLALTRPLFYVAYSEVPEALEPLLLMVDTGIWWWASTELIDGMHVGIADSIRSFGTFTLVAYLVQMPVARLCASQLRLDNAWLFYGLTLLLTFAVTFGVIRLAEALIGRFRFAKQGYKLVFG